MSDLEDPLQAFVQHIDAAGALVHQGPVADVVGLGLQIELAYLLAAIRARLPMRIADAQDPKL